MGVRALVVNDDEQVLLVRHSYGSGWYLPGGGVSRGESILDALHRELLEETGIQVSEPQRLLGVFSTTAEGKTDHVAVYVATGWTHQTRPDRTAEILDSAFFGLGALPTDASPGTQRRVAEFRGHRAPDGRW